MQNASLAKDFTLAVVDGRRGLGNGKVFPAGPLRAPLAAQLKRTDALLLVGDGAGAGTSSPRHPACRFFMAACCQMPGQLRN